METGENQSIGHQALANPRAISGRHAWCGPSIVSCTQEVKQQDPLKKPTSMQGCRSLAPLCSTELQWPLHFHLNLIPMTIDPASLSTWSNCHWNAASCLRSTVSWGISRIWAAQASLWPTILQKKPFNNWPTCSFLHPFQELHMSCCDPHLFKRDHGMTVFYPFLHLFQDCSCLIVTHISLKETIEWRSAFSPFLHPFQDKSHHNPHIFERNHWMNVFRPLLHLFQDYSCLTVTHIF